MDVLLGVIQVVVGVLTLVVAIIGLIQKSPPGGGDPSKHED